MLWMIGSVSSCGSTGITFRRKRVNRESPRFSVFIAGVANGSADLSWISRVYYCIFRYFRFLHWRQRKRKLWDFYIECGQHYWQLSEAQSVLCFNRSRPVSAWKLMGNVLTAWGQLFQPSAFSWPVAIYDGTMTTGADTVVAGKILIFFW